MTVTENVQLALRRVREAERTSGRSAGSVRLLAATKMNPPEAIREAIAAGADICAENRVQEFISKSEANAYGSCPVHFIGHLQKNKVKYLVGKVALIHSVDSAELMECIHRRSDALGTVQEILLEVNIGGEASKSGVSPAELPGLLEAAARFPALRVAGLMAIPPAETVPGKNREYFARMNELFVDIRGKKYDNVTMTELSMGMSRDYEDAVREGATIVRLGTALFGPRNYDLQEESRNGPVR